MKSKNPLEFSNDINFLGLFMKTTGLVLVSFGSFILITIAFYILSIVNDPTALPLINYLTGLVQSNEPYVSGSVDSVAFSLNLSNSAQTVSLYFISIIIIGICASVSAKLIKAGTVLLNSSK